MRPTADELVEVVAVLMAMTLVTRALRNRRLNLASTVSMALAWIAIFAAAAALFAWLQR